MNTDLGNAFTRIAQIFANLNFASEIRENSRKEFIRVHLCSSVV